VRLNFSFLDSPAFLPLRNTVFRGLWLASLVANLTMWMNDVAAAWVMTSLTNDPMMVALIQTASTLPVFLLGLPSGALADILDRRRYFAATQLMVALTAIALAFLALSDSLTAPLLLTLTFVNGIGLAMRWPVFAAIVPAVVVREQLATAMGLNSIAMNLSRVLGPLLAGVVLASVGTAAVFVLNATLGLVATMLILRWRCTPKTSTLPGERFVGAMRVGLQHVMQSPRMKVVLLRIFMFFLHATALLALLPLIARQVHGGGPGSFTLMLAFLGLGAVGATPFFPRWRKRFDRDRFVLYGTLGQAGTSVIVVLAPELWLALPAMAVLGVSWISTINSLTVASQLALPNWVRARGMSIYMMALTGGAAAGSLVWGQVASLLNVSSAVLLAAAFGPLVLLLTRRLSVEGGEDPDFSPAQVGKIPDTATDIGPHEGPIMVTVQYQIDPLNRYEFAQIMQLTRRARLRQGALSWGLFRDTSIPGRYIEYFVDETWIEHLRRLERFSAEDAGLREQRLALHIGSQEPSVKRYVAENLIL
jgi:MFS family permease